MVINNKIKLKWNENNIKMRNEINWDNCYYENEK